MIYNYIMVCPAYTDPREKVFVDMDGVLADFYTMMQRVKAILGEGADHNEIKRTQGWYLSLPPISGAVEAFHELDKHFNVYILSTPSWTNVYSWTEKRLWVMEHLGQPAYKKLILSHNKGLFSGRALIDDKKDTNQPQFDGEHIHFGHEPFEDWNKVLNYLL